MAKKSKKTEAGSGQQVVVIEATNRVRRFGFTDFTDSLRDGEVILRSGVDFPGHVVFDPGIADAIWRWKKGKFVMERVLERGEENDWSK